MEPPQILRIKRKRGQDSLQALILEDRNFAKRSKPSSPISSGARTPIEDAERPSFYFTLTRTDASNEVSDPQVLETILSETSRGETEARNFVINKKQTEEDSIIPNELSDMVNDFMLTNSDSREPRRRRRASVSTSAPSTKPIDDDEYVYDVYQLSTTTDQHHPKTQIGYIKFFEDGDDLYNGSEDSDDNLVYSDNEDSNAEDYYQNDYPEDEDADIEEDIHNEYGDTALELENDETNDLYEYSQLQNVNLARGAAEEYGTNEELEYSFEEDDDDDDEDEFDDYDEEFPRQKFFDNESEDELSMHRDKIFGRLQKMIDKED